MLLEGLAITVLGSVVGLWLGDALAKSVGKSDGAVPAPDDDAAELVSSIGVLLAVGLGVLSCAIPCRRSGGSRVVEQLRRA